MTHVRDIQIRESHDSMAYFPHLATESQDTEILYLAVALAGEVGEVCNNIKKWFRDGWTATEIRDQMKEELPDILIYLVMLSDATGVDLQSAYETKKEYNDGRFGGTATKTVRGV